jgi:cobalt-zinc-cadmium efflux system membrane fusion protein
MKRTLIVLMLLAASCSRPLPEPQGSQAEAAEAAGEGSIEMGTEAQLHIGLQTATAEIRQLTEYLSVTGTVQPLDTKVAHIRPIAPGRLTAVSVQVGDRVGSGQHLATFDNIEAGDVAAQLRAARADLEKLNVQLAVARQRTERNRQLSEIGAIARKEYELALGEERSLEAGIQAQESLIAGFVAKLRRYGLDENIPLGPALAGINAPFAGVVIAVDASAGEIVSPGSELFQIAALSQVWVQAEVYEKDLGRIQLGQTASIKVDTYPDREFAGRVTYISDMLDGATRTAKVRCEVANPQASLKLDMFATVQLPTTFSKRALAIPAEAIQQVNAANVVFVKTGEATFEQKTVEVGPTIQGMTEVLAGLEAGETVVTKGAFHLKSVVLGTEIGEEH